LVEVVPCLIGSQSFIHSGRGPLFCTSNPRCRSVLYTSPISAVSIMTTAAQEPLSRRYCPRGGGVLVGGLPQPLTSQELPPRRLCCCGEGAITPHNCAVPSSGKFAMGGAQISRWEVSSAEPGCRHTALGLQQHECIGRPHSFGFRPSRSHAWLNAVACSQFLGQASALRLRKRHQSF